MKTRKMEMKTTNELLTGLVFDWSSLFQRLNYHTQRSACKEA